MWTWSPSQIAHDAASVQPPKHLQKETWTVDQFDLKQAHRSKSSTVLVGRCKTTGAPVAIKLYRLAALSVLNRAQLQRELALHARLAHPRIIQLLAVFQDKESICLVMEQAAGGDLFTKLRLEGTLDEIYTTQQVLKPLLHALEYLHARGIIHRDIKPENLLLCGDGSGVRLADFGLSIDCGLERPVTRAGTTEYMAPEVACCPTKTLPHENKERADLGYTSAVDIWALGVLAHECLSGEPPRKGQAPPVQFSAGAADFIALCLRPDARQRPSAPELVLHPWLADQEAPPPAVRSRRAARDQQGQPAGTADPGIPRAESSGSSGSAASCDCSPTSVAAGGPAAGATRPCGSHPGRASEVAWGGGCTAALGLPRE